MFRLSVTLSCVFCASSFASGTGLNAARLSGFERLPLSFEALPGSGPQKAFLARGRGYAVSLESDGARIRLRGAQPVSLEMRFSGANGGASGEALDRLPGTVNYYPGTDRSRWRTGIPTFARVRYHGVYPGIDVIYYGNQGRLEYDLSIGPGADPRNIEMTFPGADAIRLGSEGDLVLTAAGAGITLRRPQMYQTISGKRRRVEGGYRVLAGNRVRFEPAHYDRTRPLVIDPVLSYTAVIGGSGWESTDYHGKGLAMDGAGALYVTGSTFSPNFPIAPAGAAAPTFSGVGPHVFVSKLSADGATLLYSTFIGGAGADQGTAIAVDPTGAHVSVGGFTNSANFPNTKPAQPAYAGGDDAFVLGLNGSGALVFSSLLGGPAHDEVMALAIDTAGATYAAGKTASGAAFPGGPKFGTVAAGGGDGFVAAFDPTGTLLYSGVLGGSGPDEARAVAVSGAAVYVAGATCAPAPPATANFPLVKPFLATGRNCDAFVMQLLAGGAVGWSTFLGGEGDDEAWGIAADASGVYVVGSTYADFPVTTGRPAAISPDGYADSFLAKLKPDGSGILYATLFGGAGDDFAFSVAVDPSGAPVVAGTTSSQDFPVTPDALQPAKLGSSQAVFTTADSGATWTGVVIHGLATSVVLRQAPTNPAQLYVSDGTWVYGSTDGGVTFPHALPPTGRLPSTGNDLVVDSTNPATVYAATQTAGVSKSVDSGATWSALGTGLPPNVQTLAITSDASALYAASGTSLFRYSAGAWAPVTPAWPATSAVTRLATERTGALYAGTDTGLFKTTNAGTLWTPLAPAPCAHFGSLTADPARPGTLYIADAGRFCKSADAGATWTATPIGISQPATAIAADPATPAIYAAFGRFGIYRSADAGATWSLWTGLAPFRLDNVDGIAISAGRVSVGVTTNPDVFVAHFAPAGATIASATYLGGPGSVDLSGLAVDANATYLLVPTSAPEFPLTPQGYRSPTAGSNDAHVLKIANTGACSVSLSPATLTADAGGGQARVRVIAGSGCAWGAVVTPPWVHAGSWAKQTSGLGLLEFTFDPNTTAAPRMGNVTVGTQTVTVNQPAAAAP